MGDMAAHMDKSILDLTTSDDMADLLDDVNGTMEHNRDMMRKIMKFQTDMKTFKEDVQDKILEQLNEIEKLNQTISDTDKQLLEKKREIHDLNEHIKRLNEQQENETFQLNENIGQLKIKINTR